MVISNNDDESSQYERIYSAMDDDNIHILDDSSSDRSPVSSDSANGSFMRLWDLHNGGTCSSLATLGE